MVVTELQTNFVYRMYVDKDNNKWFASEDILVYYDNTADIHLMNNTKYKQNLSFQFIPSISSIRYQFQFVLPTLVELTIYNLTGRILKHKTVVQGAGNRSLNISTEGLANGSYISAVKFNKSKQFIRRFSKFQTK